MSHRVRSQFALYRAATFIPIRRAAAFLSPHDSAICPYSSRGSQRPPFACSRLVGASGAFGQCLAGVGVEI